MGQDAMSEGGAVEHDRDAVAIADKLEALKAQRQDLKRQLQRATKDAKNEARAGKFAYVLQHSAFRETSDSSSAFGPCRRGSASAL